MVRVSSPDGATFCIDTTEVTRAHFQTFFNNAPFDKSKIPAECNPQYWASFALRGGGETGHPCNNPEIRYPSTKESGEVPVECASWCNAKIYCEWAGKRLCGGLGKKGEGNTLEEANEAKKDEWMFACTQGGKTTYSTGDAYKPGECDEGVMKGADPKAVSETTSCHGQSKPFDQVFNLMGNLMEWDANCEMLPQKIIGCGLRGFDQSLADGPPSCGTSAQVIFGGVSTAEKFTGIRCCAD